MFRRVGAVCAGVLLCAVVGCTLDSFLVSVTGRDGRQQVVAGSVDDVSAHLQAALGRTGILVNINHQGSDVRIAGKTRSGKSFALVLKEQNAGGTRQTAVGIEWQGEADEAFWGTIVEVLATAPPQRLLPGPETHEGPWR
jgi:hypothetical protein